MTDRILVTEDINEKVQQPDAPAGMAVGVLMVDTLVAALLNHDVQTCSKVSAEIIKIPGVAEATITAAIGVIAQCELKLRSAMEVVDSLDPDTIQTLIGKVE